VNTITDIDSALLKEIHHWQKLSVVRHQSKSHTLVASHKGLQDLQSNCDNLRVSGVQGDFEGGDQRWDHWKNLEATLLKHVKYPLDREEAVRVLLLANSFEEHWQVAVILELRNIDFPIDSVIGGSVLGKDWEVTSHVKSAETCLRYSSGAHGSCSWFHRRIFRWRFQE